MNLDFCSGIIIGRYRSIKTINKTGESIKLESSRPLTSIMKENIKRICKRLNINCMFSTKDIIISEK